MVELVLETAMAFYLALRALDMTELAGPE